jgi:hypothetical protein
MSTFTQRDSVRCPVKTNISVLSVSSVGYSRPIDESSEKWVITLWTQMVQAKIKNPDKEIACLSGMFVHLRYINIIIV